MNIEIVFKTVNTIDQVPRKTWDAMVEDNPYMTWGWLKTVEETSILPQEAYYILAMQQQQLVGGTVCSVTKRSSKMLNIDDIIFGRLKKMIHSFNLSLTPLLICSPLRGRGTHLLVKSDLNEQQKKIILTALLGKVEELARSEKCGVAFSGIQENQVNLRNTLGKRGYFQTFAYPTSILDIKWSDFDDYLSDKQTISKKIKQNIKNQINRNSKAGVTISETLNPKNFGDRLHELSTLNYQKHNNMSFMFNSLFFATLKKNLGDDANILVAQKKELVIGVIVILKKNGYANSCFIGVDHETAGNDYTYFNLAYYAPIKEAIQSNFRRIDYGNGMYSIKIDRGCHLAQTYLFYKPKHYPQRIFISIWFRFHAFWSVRKLSNKMRAQLRVME